MQQQKKHFSLVCGQVAWRKDAEAEAIQVLPVNAVVAYETAFIRQFNLAQINAQLINNLATMIGEEIKPDLVAGVTMLSISSLGFMTEEEFRAQPKGMAIEKEVRTVVEEAISQPERA